MSEYIVGQVVVEYRFDKQQIVEQFGELSDEGLQEVCDILSAYVNTDVLDDDLVEFTQNNFYDCLSEVISDIQDSINEGEIE